MPGRLGPEFIARLTELEQFAASSPIYDAGCYAGGPADFEEAKVGTAPILDDSLPFHFQQYSNLNSSRLKLAGDGSWPLSDYLDDEFWMPYQEPKILHHNLPLRDAVGPNLASEDKEENLKLALLWDSKGLLSAFRNRPHQGAFARIFNARKDEARDRQIGDRRYPNFTERHLTGPSKFLPGGYLLTSLHVPPGHVIHGSISDRKDFYHQAKVTRERAFSNVLPFSYPEEHFAGGLALNALHKLEQKDPKSREVIGDNLRGERCSSTEIEPAGRIFCGFSSLLQGDHLGVEFALASHAELLQRHSLLCPSERVQGNSPFPLGPLYQGLVIDDFFALSVDPIRCNPKSSPSATCFQRALVAYEKAKLLGSPEKDIEGSRHFKVIGAEINSSDTAVSRGVISVSAPVSKRLAMLTLSLRVARLPFISCGLASRLCGNWTSILLFRRCLTCLLSSMYKISSKIEALPDDVSRLSRRTADEFVLCAVFSFVACTNVAVPFHERIFATDASIRKGAVVSRPVDRETSKAVWLSGGKKGAYTMLEKPFAEILKTCDEKDEDSPIISPDCTPARSFDFTFDFVEVCGGAASVSAVLADWGYSVMPPIELSDSPHFNIRDLKVVNWLCNMLKSKRLRAMMLEPVCTTFSPAAHPNLRSYSQPRGYDPTHERTKIGNEIAFHCLFLAWYAASLGCPTVVEQPRLSKMAWLSVWRFLLTFKGFAEAIVASCQFGSIHRKEFRLLTHGLDAQKLTCRCPGGHAHVPIEGKYTKFSAVYVPEPAKHFARAFHEALRRDLQKRLDEPDVDGLESVIGNDLLLTGNWECDLVWHWKHSAHINLLESHAFLALLKVLALEGEDSRFVALLDSQVAKCAHAKGRSGAAALAPSIRKPAALQVGHGLYPSFGFAPTRLNVADDPTRDAELRISSASSLIQTLSPEKIKSLHARPFAELLQPGFASPC